MTPITKLKIQNLDELRHERFLLRSRSEELETEIKDQYKEIADQVKPVLAVIKRVTHLKDTISDKFHINNDQPALQKGAQIAKMALPLVPFIAGKLLFKRGKKLMFQSIAGYGITQLTRYILSKNVDEHAESVKSMFSFNKKDQEKGIF